MKHKPNVRDRRETGTKSLMHSLRCELRRPNEKIYKVARDGAYLAALVYGSLGTYALNSIFGADVHILAMEPTKHEDFLPHQILAKLIYATVPSSSGVLIVMITAAHSLRLFHQVNVNRKQSSD